MKLLKTLMAGAALVVGLGGMAQAEDKTKVASADKDKPANKKNKPK